MAYLAAANVTVTLAQKDIIPLGMSKKMTFPSIAYGNSSLQYPALGIPMPVKANFGFKAQIDRVFIEQPANGFVYHFDRTNHKLRLFNGAGAGTLAVANHVGVAPTGNVSTAANHVGVAPTGNLANLAAGAFTGDALANITPAGNLANLAPAAHSHSLVIAGNGAYPFDVDVGANEASAALSGNIANAVTILGGNATTGGIANTTPGNSSGDFVGDALAPGTPAGNVANGTGDFVGDAPANFTHAAQTFTGDAPANFTHTVTGSLSAGALVEMATGTAPAATTIYMQMIGR